jgi:hypothetical protein
MLSKVADGYTWVRENDRSLKPVKVKEIDWVAKSLYATLTMHRDNPKRDKQVRKNRRINKLLCRGLCPDGKHPNWKVGCY